MPAFAFLAAQTAGLVCGVQAVAPVLALAKSVHQNPKILITRVVGACRICAVLIVHLGSGSPEHFCAPSAKLVVWVNTELRAGPARLGIALRVQTSPTTRTTSSLLRRQTTRVHGNVMTVSIALMINAKSAGYANPGSL